MKFFAFRFLFSICIVLLLFLSTTVKADEPFVVSNPEKVADLVIYTGENRLVHTAGDLFANDVFAVTGRIPDVKSTSDSPYQIKVGTLGLNLDFDKECAANGIDIESLKGKWETYILKVIQDEGKYILYVVGSDPRGTAYGLMELSRSIGVSPWCWWADVQPEKRKVLELPGDLYKEGEPQVKYRGIFLNDEG